MPRMSALTCGLGGDAPESQRITIPSPLPFPGVKTRARSPGAYRIVNEQPVTDEEPVTRRCGYVTRGA